MKHFNLVLAAIVTGLTSPVLADGSPFKKEHRITPGTIYVPVSQEFKLKDEVWDMDSMALCTGTPLTFDGKELKACDIERRPIADLNMPRSDLNATQIDKLRKTFDPDFEYKPPGSWDPCELKKFREQMDICKQPKVDD
ncbi:hypothetical protein CDD83_401 [Cordyceps sp. RAO-2017]|nr:hypothetical protein CDD83_401 [Cordyceps sp. RAO-2017]